MQHRHSGPPVKYRTRRGRIMHREHPLHPITRKRKREGRRISRGFSFSDRERHSDSIVRLQREHRGLREKLDEVRSEMDDEFRKSIMEEQKNIGGLSQIMFNKPEEELTDEERIDVQEESLTEGEKKVRELIDEETNLFEKIEDKLTAIKEEKEFLEDDE